MQNDHIDGDQRLYQHDVLSREQTDALLARYRRLADKNGPASKRALKVRNQLVTANLKLVAFVAKRYQTPRGWSPEDVRAHGVAGLIKAIETFDASHGTALGTHAVWQIRHAVGRAIADGAHVVRIPVHVQESARLGRDTAAVRLAAGARRMLSTDARVAGPDGDSRTTFGDMLPDHETDDSCQALVDGETERRVRAAVAALQEPLRTVVTMRLDGATLDEVGERIPGRRSRESVRQLELTAHAKLRKALGAGECAA